MSELINDAEIEKQIAAITHINLRPVMADIGQILLLSIEDNVREGGRYSRGEGDGGSPSAWSGGTQKFAPLSESTKKSKERRGRTGGLILQDSGRMIAAMDARVTDNSVEITNNVLYFPHVTLGTKPGTKPVIPARPLLVVQEEDLEEISITVSEFISKELS